MTVGDAPPRWDLTPLYRDLDDRAFNAALEAVHAGIDRLVALYDHHGIRAVPPRRPDAGDAAALDAVLEATNALQRALRPVTAYLYARVTTDSRDERAAALTSELQQRSAPLGPLLRRLDAWIASLGADALAAASGEGARHAFALRKAEEQARFQMGEAEESLAAELAPSGSLAWQRLHGDLTSQLTVALRRPDAGADTVETADADAVEIVPMSVARGLATHPDAGLRRAAYEAELEAWAGAAVPLAAALNGAKGEAAVLNRRRGYADDLEPNLAANNVDRATLEAMTAAVVAALPDFRRYLRAKASVLGHPGPLPWWDLLAPVGRAATVTWPGAADLVAGAFAGYGPTLAGLADRALRERWIDAEPRDGKRGGAYCVGFGGAVSRIMMNFDGSYDSVATLAHELGHAYHNTALAERTPVQRRLPMALAETASIFCETLLFSAALDGVTDPGQRLALLDTHLVGATAVVVDIHSRFLFETELCRRRRRAALSVRELCSLMADAQEAAYGDGLHPDHRHPYMWAVKGHYFTPFYNWPYTFGLLFGLGLHTRYLADPDRFRAGYDELLSTTGMSDAAGLAARFDIDVSDGEFWTASLDVLRRSIDSYEELIRQLSSMPTTIPSGGDGSRSEPRQGTDDPART